MDKLEEYYAESEPSGTLHLENYSKNSKAISFIPSDIDNSDNSDDDSDGGEYVSPFGDSEE